MLNSFRAIKLVEGRSMNNKSLSNLNINTIQVDKVFDVVNKLLNNQSNV